MTSEDDVVFLRMFQADVTESDLQRIGALKARLEERFRPLLRPALRAAGDVLGVAPETLRRVPAPHDLYEQSRVALGGEVYADGKTLIVLRVQSGRRRSIPGTAVPQTTMKLNLSAIGPDLESEPLLYSVAAVQDILGVTLGPLYYASERFKGLDSEGRQRAPEPTHPERRAANVLRDRALRVLALAIKSSGGLLVRDLAKQLPTEDRPQAVALTAALKETGLIESEIVVVCGKSQAQVMRAANRDLLADLSSKGIKCACGRPLIEERVEEALAITDLGRSMLDKGRWLTILLVEELPALGISSDSILVEQNVGGDEIDCLANISGELALFELKDKEFSLGNAYSFGAKIAITNPEHQIIVTTERVGNDAREHFKRARLAGGAKESPNFDPEGQQSREISYIEGVESMREALRALVGAIYRKDAATILDSVLPLAALGGEGLVRAIEIPDLTEGDLVQDELPQSEARLDQATAGEGR